MKLIVSAMKEEVNKLIDEKIVVGKLYDLPKKNAKLLVTGIGKVNAAINLTKVIVENEITEIINVGFAGATKPFMVNDCVVVTNASYHDFDLTVFGYEKGQVPNFPTLFTSDSKLYKSVKKLLITAKEAVIYTGDYFMTDATKEAILVDMEAASLYQVAATFNIPIISIKVVSDIINSNNHYENYKKFEESLGALKIREVVYKLLED